MNPIDGNEYNVHQPKKVVAETPFSFAPEIVLSAYTFSWINHEQLLKSKNPKDNIKSIMSGIALVSALCLTIWMSILFQDFAGRLDLKGEIVEIWKTNTLVTILWIGAILQALSMVDSVFMSALVEACSGDCELNEFISRVPNALRMPVVFFYVAILTGVAGMLWYFYMFFDTGVLCVQVVVMFVLAMCMNAAYYQGNVAALKGALETTKENQRLVFTKLQIDTKLKAYIENNESFEFVDPPGFLNYLSNVEGVEVELAYVTKCRANQAFESFIQKQLSSESGSGTGL